MSFIKGFWSKIGTVLGWIIFYLTELAVFITIILVVLWLISLIPSEGGSLIVVPAVGAIIYWVWVVWLIVVAVLLFLMLGLLVIDTLVNFFWTWWKSGFGPAWEGLTGDLRRSWQHWFKGFSEELNERGTAVVNAVKKVLTKAKDAIVDGIDWVKSWFK